MIPNINPLRVLVAYGFFLVAVIIAVIGLYAVKPYLFQFAEAFLDDSKGGWLIIELLECATLFYILHALHVVVRRWSGLDARVKQFERNMAAQQEHFKFITQERDNLLRELDCNRESAKEIKSNPSILEESRELVYSKHPELMDDSVDVPALLYKGHIFVIDDDPATLSLLKAMLRVLAGEGYKVKVFSCPEDAVLACDTTKPKLIIADYMMPITNGLQMVRRMRLKGVTAPAIIVSGIVIDQETQETLCPENGIACQILKPLTDAKFIVTKVREALAMVKE